MNGPTCMRCGKHHETAHSPEEHAHVRIDCLQAQINAIKLAIESDRAYSRAREMHHSRPRCPQCDMPTVNSNCGLICSNPVCTLAESHELFEPA